MPSRKESATANEAATPPSVLPLQATLGPPVTAPPASTTSTAALMELMMMNMIQQQQATMNSRLHPGRPPTPVLPAAISKTPNTASSAAPATGSFPLPDVSLEDFCTRYSVEPKDKARLEKMEFRAGDDLDILGPDDWKDFGGFMALSWSRIKAKNQEFLRDACLGLWNK